jgi:predicted transcriptional regulator
MPKKGKLSESQKLAVRASYDKHKLSGMSAQKAMELVAEEWGVHWQTIRKVLKGTTTVDPELLADVKSQQATQIDEIVDKLLNHTNRDEVIKRLSGAQSTMAICQLIDKALKLRGEDVTKVEIYEVGEKVQKRLEELQALKGALQQSLVVPNKPEDN